MSDYEIRKKMYEDEFKSQIPKFIDLLEEVIGLVAFYNKNSDQKVDLEIGLSQITFARSALLLISGEVLIRKYINHSWKNWDKLHSRNMEDIKNSLPTFDGFEKYFDQIASVLCNTEIVNTIISDKLLDLLNLITKQCIRYIHHCRDPKYNPSKERICYTKSCFDEIKLKKHIEEFQVKQ